VPSNGAQAGKKTTAMEVIVEEIGPSLRWVIAEVAKAANTAKTA
jgi:hypothetical protein